MLVENRQHALNNPVELPEEMRVLLSHSNLVLYNFFHTHYYQGLPSMQPSSDQIHILIVSLPGCPLRILLVFHRIQRNQYIIIMLFESSQFFWFIPESALTWIHEIKFSFECLSMHILINFSLFSSVLGSPEVSTNL